MDVREKLVDLLKTSPTRNGYTDLEDIADHLISNGVTVQEWFPAKETLPRNYIPVLTYIPALEKEMQQAVHECHIGADGEWHSATAPAYWEEVTHWMQMPEPPLVQAQPL